MIIKSIIKRYSNKFDSPLNIVSTHCDNRKFQSFLEALVHKNSHIVSLEDSLYGNCTIDMIICHNKINYLDKCGRLAYFFHCPILVIDHDVKPKFIEKDIVDFQSSSIYNVAINHTVYNSWGSTHDLVLNFDINNSQNIETWKNLLYQITKIPFNLKEKEYIDEDKKE